MTGFHGWVNAYREEVAGNFDYGYSAIDCGVSDMPFYVTNVVQFPFHQAIRSTVMHMDRVAG